MMNNPALVPRPEPNEVPVNVLTPSGNRLRIDNVIQFLFRRGYLSSQDIVDTPDAVLQAMDYTRRNRNFKIVPPTGTGLLVKQCMEPESPEFRSGMEVEAGLLQAAATDPSLAGVRWFAPRFIHFDRRDMILVTELVHPATTLTRYHLNVGEIQFPEDAAITAARLLAGFHLFGTNAVRKGVVPFVSRRTPSVWEALRTLEHPRGDGGEHRAELRKLIAERAGFWDRLPRLRASWKEHDSLVHVDPRWDNFLLTHGAGPVGNLNLKLIDWELATIGDPAWDIGYFLCEYLRFWFFFGTTTPKVENLDDLMTKTRYQFDKHHASTILFWKSYCRRQRLAAPARKRLWRRVLDMLPFNLTLIAHESLQSADRSPWLYRVSFELALQAAADPEGCAKRWFGIDTPGA